MLQHTCCVIEADCLLGFFIRARKSLANKITLNRILGEELNRHGEMAEGGGSYDIPEVKACLDCPETAKGPNVAETEEWLKLSTSWLPCFVSVLEGLADWALT